MKYAIKIKRINTTHPKEARVAVKATDVEFVSDLFLYPPLCGNFSVLLSPCRCIVVLDLAVTPSVDVFAVVPVIRV